MNEKKKFAYLREIDAHVGFHTGNGITPQVLDLNKANGNKFVTNCNIRKVRNEDKQETYVRVKPKWEDTITNRMLHWSYTPEQKEEVKKALAAGVPKATILTYFYPEVTVEKMSTYRKKG